MVLDEEIAARLGVAGVVIDQVVPVSSAEHAGLKGIDYYNRLLGDIIVGVEGNPIAKMDDFIKNLRNVKIGEVVKLQVRRGDEIRELMVKVMDIS
jgi:2-alkenal reductase